MDDNERKIGMLLAEFYEDMKREENPKKKAVIFVQAINDLQAILHSGESVGKRKYNKYEGFILRNGKRGDCFFTEKEQKDMTALAHYHKRKISTESVLMFKGTVTSPQSKTYTKVTILK